MPVVLVAPGKTTSASMTMASWNSGCDPYDGGRGQDERAEGQAVRWAKGNEKDGWYAGVHEWCAHPDRHGVRRQTDTQPARQTRQRLAIYRYIQPALRTLAHVHRTFHASGTRDGHAA